MSGMKTRPTDASVEEFLAAVDHPGRREDALALLPIMNRVTGTEPRMWGDSLVGYGEYAYSRADGSRHSFFLTGFSPRKANLVVYLMAGVGQHADKLPRLGRHRHSSSCLYLGRLKSVDLDVLAELVADDLAIMRQRYPEHRL